MKSNGADDKIDGCINNPRTFFDVDLDDAGTSHTGVKAAREAGSRR